jgi:hypothetical protein
VFRTPIHLLRAAVAAMLGERLSTPGQELAAAKNWANVPVKRRRGFSAKSTQGVRLARVPGAPRLARATGPGTYAELSPQQCTNTMREQFGSFWRYHCDWFKNTYTGDPIV